VQADHEVSQGGHDLGCIAGVDLGQVFAEGDVSNA